MKILNLIFAVLVASALFSTIGCTKDESFVSDAATSEIDDLPTSPEATIVWLEENGIDLHAHEGADHEGFRPNAEVTGTKQVMVDIYGEPTLVDAQIIDGYVVVEGDIVLGTEEEVDNQLDSRGSVHSSASRRWANRTMYYEINPAIYTNPLMTIKVISAITVINANTNLNLVARTNQSDYVKINLSTDGNYSTSIGKSGGMQEIYVTSSAPIGTVIHEFLHAAGLWHEQSRCDRNDYVSIMWSNIKSGKDHNFTRRCASNSGQDVGSYNISSVMHYPGTAFSTNGNATIVPNIPKLFELYNYNIFSVLGAIGQMGQREKLTTGDIQTVNAIYPR